MEKLFLYIEADHDRRREGLEAMKREFPDVDVIAIANRAEAMTELTKHHSPDGIIAGGKANNPGNGSLDMLEYVERTEIGIPCVIASGATREAVDQALRSHPLLSIASDHIFTRKADAPPFTELFEAVRFLKSLPRSAKRPGFPIGSRASKRDPA